MPELGEIIEITIKRAGMRLLCPKLGTKSVFKHVVGHVITLDGQQCLRVHFVIIFRLHVLISYETLSHSAGNR